MDIIIAVNLLLHYIKGAIVKALMFLLSWEVREMSRTARIFSESGFSHVMIRGVGRQVLFECADDYYYFIFLMKKYCEEMSLEVNAYCLMDNHVHMLLHDTGQELPDFMKKIGVSYALYFNSKYDRTGHLFQDRYKSIPIESERQLLATFRYILQNPEKAGICRARDYTWSSYREYGRQKSFTKTDLIEEALGTFAEFEQFMSIEEEQNEEYEPIRKSNDEAHDIVLMVLGADSGTVLQKYGKEERNEVLRVLKKQGLSIRQIERLTGIGRSIIQRA